MITKVKAFVKNHVASFVTAGVVLVYGGLRYHDQNRSYQIKQGFMPQAKELANQPMKVEELPRRILVVVSLPNYGKWEFTEFVKPVLDTAAVDYTVVDLKEKGDVEKAVAQLETLGRVEGILAVGTPAFKEMINGIAKRQEEGTQQTPLAVGFVPLTNIGLYRLPYSHFVHFKRWELMGPPALAAALGNTRDLTKEDLQEVQLHEDSGIKPEEVVNMVPCDLTNLAFFTLQSEAKWA